MKATRRPDSRRWSERPLFPPRRFVDAMEGRIEPGAWTPEAVATSADYFTALAARGVTVTFSVRASATPRAKSPSDGSRAPMTRTVDGFGGSARTASTNASRCGEEASVDAACDEIAAKIGRRCPS
jgi:hypothetical protein